MFFLGIVISSDRHGLVMSKAPLTKKKNRESFSISLKPEIRKKSIKLAKLRNLSFSRMTENMLDAENKAEGI